jgi:arabinogalactan oligomer/maltooligosaccharide transport system substrate-binding protein
MQFSTMPTWGGKVLTPLLKVKVYVLNAYSTYPSAAAEMLRIIFTKEGMEAMIQNSAYVPALKAGAKISPDFSKDVVKGQMLKAFAKSYVEPVTVVLPNVPSKQAVSFWNGANIVNQFYQDVWDGKKTPAEAQKGLIEAYTAWYAENNKK